MKRSIFYIVFACCVTLSYNVFSQYTYRDSLPVNQTIDLRLSIQPKYDLLFMPYWINSLQKLTMTQQGTWLVKGSKVGVDTIDFSDLNNKHWARFIIKYVEPKKNEITINTLDTISLYINETYPITATVLQSSAPQPTAPRIKWSVDDPSIIHIDTTLFSFQIIVTALKVGTTVLHSHKEGAPMGGGGGLPGNTGGEPMQPWWNNQVMDDSIVLVVKALKPCSTVIPLASNETYCKNQSVNLTSLSGAVYWFTDVELTNSLGYGTSYRYTVADTNTNLYLAQRVGQCMNIIAHRVIKIADASLVSDEFLKQIDTVFFGVATQLHISYPNMKWYDYKTVTLISQGSEMPIRNVLGKDSMFIQRTDGCIAPMRKINFVVRFVPKYTIKGRVHVDGSIAARLFLIDKVSYQNIDSCELQSDKSFTLFVPRMGQYTIEVAPQSLQYRQTFYGNKGYLPRANYITIGNETAENTIIEDVDITLLKSLTDASSESTGTCEMRVGNGELQISFPNADSYHVTAYNLSGLPLFDYESSTSFSSYSLQQLPAGVFIVRVQPKDASPVIRYFYKDWK